MFVFFYILSYVSSTPPVLQTSQNIKGFDIKIPDIFVVKFNQDTKFHFHVFNLSNGIPINATTVNCIFHLYDYKGSHLYKKENLPVEDNYDYTMDLKKGNFTTIGEYSYIAQCNDTYQGGFVSVPIQVTNTGFILSNEQSLIYIIVTIFSMMIFLVALLSSIMIKWKNHVNENNDYIGVNYLKYFKVIAMWICYLSFMAINLMIYSFMNTFPFYDGLAKIFYTIYRFQFAMMFVFVSLTLIFLLIVLFTDRKIWKNIDRGLRMK